jgi:hypothetical protein
MSRPPVATAMEHYQSQAYQPELEVDSPTFAARVYREVMPRNCCASSPAAELPSTIDFSQHIYPTESAPPIYPTETTSPIDQLPPAAPEQIRVALNSATAITFTSASDNRQTGQQPDYFLGTDGVLRANPNKKQPNADGSINIELQAKNKFETDAKKFADQLQKAAVKDLISYFSRSNPGAKVPQDWLDQLSKEPDLPPPVVPLALDSQPVPDLPPPPIDQPQQYTLEVHLTSTPEAVARVEVVVVVMEEVVVTEVAVANPRCPLNTTAIPVHLTTGIVPCMPAPVRRRTEATITRAPAQQTEITLPLQQCRATNHSAPTCPLVPGVVTQTDKFQHQH